MKKFLSNHRNILLIILAGFFFRELSLVAIVPLFGGQDEARHYNTIQLINNPKIETAGTIVHKQKSEKEKEQLETYNFSEEIREAAKLSQVQQTRKKHYDKMIFSESSIGLNEKEMSEKKDLAFNKFYPPDAVSGTHLYHSLASNIEKVFENKSIYFRFFSVRIFSISLGTLVIFFTYLIAKNIGLSNKESLLIAAITSFHPKLSIYLTNINYDALVIPIFTAFTFFAISSIKNGLNWKNLGALLIISTLGFLTKGTSIILFALLFILIIFHAYKLINWQKINKKLTIVTTSLLSLILLSAIFYGFLKGKLSFDFPLFFEYLSGSFSKIPSSFESYWGNLNWTSNDYSEYFIKLIWAFEIISYIGLALFLVGFKKLKFVAKKEYVFAFIIIFLCLQAGIRFYDWRVFSRVGSLELGTPGRYFLPTIASHILIICTGMGIILKKRKYFEKFLTAWLILMFLFFFHLILNSIIPVYYL